MNRNATSDIPAPLDCLVICPICRSLMILRNSRYGKFWGCSQWPKCKATHGAHPDGRPLGVPGNDATKISRIEAHAKFDTWWKVEGITRKEAYRNLQRIMNLSKNDAHIGRFTVEQCRMLMDRI